MDADAFDPGGEQQRKVKWIFAEVCDLDPDIRRSRLDALCGNDLPLRRAAERLLQYDCADSIFEGDMDECDSGVSRVNAPRPDEWIGRTVQSQKILERIGQGGMGVVYRGEDVGLRRQVAKFLSAHPVTSLNQNLPEELDRVVAKALQRDTAKSKVLEAGGSRRDSDRHPLVRALDVGARLKRAGSLVMKLSKILASR